MSKHNNFTFRGSKVYRKSVLAEEDQMTWVNEIDHYKKPLIYERHIWFVNFPSFNRDMPLYINLIRTPVERFISWFYYQQTAGFWPPEMCNITMDECIERDLPQCTTYNHEVSSYILIPYFCGQEEFCKYPSRRALLQAKENVIRYNAVVGTTENYDIFLTVLEHVLPQFFKGIVKKSKRQKRLNKAKNVKTISPENRSRIEKLMSLEYELYDFIQSRLLQLHQIVSATS